MRCGYLDYETTPGTYTFHQSKICKIIDQINGTDGSHLESNQPVRRSDQQHDSMSLDKKHKDLELFVNLLIDLNILSEEKTIAKKELIRDVFYVNKQLLPHVIPSEVRQSYIFLVVVFYFITMKY
jgi:hypothetical protein